MRRTGLVLLAVVLCVPSLGCLAVASNVRGARNKSVVVYNNELYVVDLTKCEARRVNIAEGETAMATEIDVVGEDD